MPPALPDRIPLRTAPRTVVGYHGCSRAAAQYILEENHFLPSTNAYDWLGQGIYFWEFAPYRALDWAIVRCASSGEAPVVLGATIQLGRCLNLLDISASSGLVRAYEQVGRNVGIRTMPRNTEAGAHFLDCTVIDTYCAIVEEATNKRYQTVRGCYPEGEPVFSGSKILTRAHVQIAVRDPSCITRVHLVQFP